MSGAASAVEVAVANALLNAKSVFASAARRAASSARACWTAARRPDDQPHEQQQDEVEHLARIGRRRCSAAAR